MNIDKHNTSKTLTLKAKEERIKWKEIINTFLRDYETNQIMLRVGLKVLEIAHQLVIRSIYSI